MSSDQSRRPLVCYHCKQPGHHIRDCRNRAPAVQSSALPSSSGVQQQEENQQRIKKLLITIGEQSLNTVEKNLAVLASALTAELTANRSFVLSTLLHAVKALPAKHNVYAALTALIAVSSPGFAADVLLLLSTALPHALRTGQHDEQRLLLRFLLCLSHVRLVSVDDVYALLQQQLQWIEAASSSLFRDYYLYGLVSLLPWMGVEHHSLPAFRSLLSALASLMSRRPPPSPLLRVFTAPDSPSEDLLAAYWQAAQAAAQQTGEAGIGWRSELIMRPHLKLASSVASLTPASFSLTLPLPPASAVCPSLPPLLALFPDTPLSPSLSPSSLSHYVVITQLLDTLLIFEAIHAEATKQLLLLSTGEDYSPILISTLFASLLSLPSPRCLPVYVAAVIIDLFRVEPKAIPPIIGLAINALFERLDGVDAEAFSRLVLWFSFHLSNFSFVWPWSNWAAVLETDEWTGQRVFVVEAFARCVRLSFWERIQQTIPEELVALMPHQPKPAFRFDTPAGAEGELAAGKDGNVDMAAKREGEDEKKEAAAGTDDTSLPAVAAAVLSKLREKAGNEEIVNFLSSSLGSSASLSSPAQLLFPCILHAGNKSYSHLFALFDRYSGLIAHYLPASALQLVHSISEYWQHSHQHVLVILDAVLQRGWVRHAAVLHWLLEGGGAKVEELHYSFAWELTAMVMDRLSRQQEERAAAAAAEEEKGGEDAAMSTAAEDERVEAVRALLTGLSRVLRVGGKHEGLLPYVESRARALDQTLPVARVERVRAH